ncbi:MAG: fatty acid hydroxylase [Bacteroidota bacterium]|nr:fatty acid hydroxylase [Bacteroidota bacterium]
MERIEIFRQRFRAENISKNYRGFIHLAFINVWCVAGIVICAVNIHHPTFWQWMVIPFTFLYTNLFEYIGHRFPMHHRYNSLKAVFKRHTLQHHHFFTDENMNCESADDFKIILFPPVLLIFFSVCFVVPVSLLVYYLFSQNAAMFFIATTLTYYLNYEWLHLSYHLPETHFVYKVPGLKTLRNLHHQHHNHKAMDQYNFNITYPVFDIIFGTLKSR